MRRAKIFLVFSMKSFRAEVILLWRIEAYGETFENLRYSVFAKIVHGFQPSTIFAKRPNLEI